MAETEAIYQLEQQLAELLSLPEIDTRKKVDLLNDLAWQLSDIDPKQAYTRGEEAYALACGASEGRSPYQIGMAYAMRTLGYLNQRAGAHALGLSQLLEAQELCAALQLADGLTDVLDGIAGIYFQISNFPEALSYTHRQLEAAQRLGDKRRIANAYNNLAVIYSATGDYARAIETLEHNLQLAVESGSDRIRTLALLNLAETNLLAGDNERALDFVMRGLRASQAAGFALFEVYALSITGDCYRKMGSTAQALPYLEQALTLSRPFESKTIEEMILFDLGQAHHDMQQLDLALEFLRQSLALADSIDARSESFNAHLLLSEIYAEQGAPVRAFEHFKQYHALKELVYGEKADERLKVLQVAYDTKTARKEAEIARLRAMQLEQEIVEHKQKELVLQEVREQLEQQVALRTAELRDSVVLLQHEIEERERAEAEIQQLVATLEQRVAARTDELATFFDLTLLAGQADSPNEVFVQALPRITEVTQSRAICIHLFDAEHSALRLAGQLNLADEGQMLLATVQPEADFWRWLHHPAAPLVTMNLADMAILPVALRPAAFHSYLGAQIKVGSRIEGLLSCYRHTERGFGVDEIALVTALAEQLGMTLETQRLRQQGEEMAVVEERQRLARDLHDSVTQTLYSLSLFSRAGRDAAEDGDTARLNRNLIELERNTLHALREMRLLLYELRPADLQQEGLVRAIELRLNTVERRVGLQLDVHLEELPALPPAHEVELYHLIVEALNNVVKHAAASRLSLYLTAANGRLQLRIADDGHGFDPAHPTGGLGLRNMRERVAQLNGQLSIESSPGSGVRLAAIIPYPLEETS